MPNFFFTNQAVDDLTNIWDYTRNVWSENQAEIYYNLIIENCSEIAFNPTIGKEYNHVIDGLWGMRVASHIIFYRILPNQNIEITRILHSKMDFKRRMSE